MARRALSSKGVRVEVVGQDCHEIIMRQAKRMNDQHEAALQKQREYDSVYHYDHEHGVETIVCLVKRAHVSAPEFYATTVVEIGKAGLVTSRAGSERMLDAEMRLALARAYYASGICKNYEEGRERAKKVKFIFERAEAFASAKNEGVSV